MICRKPSLKPPATELGKHLGITQRKCFSVQKSVTLRVPLDCSDTFAAHSFGKFIIILCKAEAD